MNKTYGLTPENIFRALPDVLKNDEDMRALARSIVDALSARADEIENLRIYSRIDELPEPLLDILAYDFKVDWWDANDTLEQKRKTLKDSWNVHRTLGTKYAVETAVSALFARARIKEWFQYGGRPYTFQLFIKLIGSGLTREEQESVLNRIRYYKSLRSHLDAIYYEAADMARMLYVTGAATGTHMETTLTEGKRSYNLVRAAKFGCAMGSFMETALPLRT